ncbi:hypothetical protein Y239_14440 [Listeria monocytogenes]|nr:hypothetical protein [Listeria monocytogenes]
MKRTRFHFNHTENRAASFCPYCAKLKIVEGAREIFKCIKINRPVYVKCLECRKWYNIGGEDEE